MRGPNKYQKLTTSDIINMMCSFSESLFEQKVNVECYPCSPVNINSLSAKPDNGLSSNILQVNEPNIQCGGLSFGNVLLSPTQCETFLTLPANNASLRDIINILNITRNCHDGNNNELYMPNKVESEHKYFKVIVLTDNESKRYRCPECLSESGIAAPKDPTNFDLFCHNYGCSNKNCVPRE